MSFTERLGRLVFADAHGVLDALEDRRLALRQALREAEAAHAGQRARLDALDEQRRALDEELPRLERACEEADRDVELALARDRDDLARFAVRRLIPARRALERARERRESLEETAASERVAVEERGVDLEDLRARVRDEIARLERVAEASSDGARSPASSDAARPSDEEVELELLRRRTAEEAS